MTAAISLAREVPPTNPPDMTCGLYGRLNRRQRVRPRSSPSFQFLGQRSFTKRCSLPFSRYLPLWSVAIVCDCLSDHGIIFIKPLVWIMNTSVRLRMYHVKKCPCSTDASASFSNTQSCAFRNPKHLLTPLYRNKPLHPSPALQPIHHNNDHATKQPPKFGHLFADGGK